MNRILFIMIFLLLCLPCFSNAETEIQETYMVAMRDGVKLATEVYRPNDAKQHPVILYRTPYNKLRDGMDEAVITLIMLMGYAYVTQDTRGRYGSEGIDSVFFTDGWGALQDGYDTIEWISRQAWCNGKIGMLGASATGITTYRATGALHLNLVCAVAVVATSDFYSQTVYPGGEFRKSLVEGWIQDQGADHILPFLLENPYYNATWETMNLHTRTAQITIPMMHIGGWYDCFSEGTVAAFADLQHQPNSGPQKLLMGPWTHAKIGTAAKVGELEYPDAAFDVINYGIPWLDYWLRGTQNGIMEKPTVIYYLMGDPDRQDEIGCQWLEADTWPPDGAEQLLLYLQNSANLGEQVPPTPDSVRYDFDPENPVPTRGGANLNLPAGPFDQRTSVSRDDMIEFTGAVLTNPVRVEGYVRAQLYISSNCPDTDFTLKLIDVYPDGRELLVTDGIQRARFRYGYTTAAETLLTPGKIEAIAITLPPVAIVFNSGHRIKICISSSNYPRYEINPNTGAAPNDRSDPQIATNTVYFGAEYPSKIMLPVLNTPAAVATVQQPLNSYLQLHNYPNPFNAATTIRFVMPAREFVTLTIFNGVGQKVKLLIQDVIDAGEHHIYWDGNDASGIQVASGIYLYQLQIKQYRQVGKMLLVR